MSSTKRNKNCQIPVFIEKLSQMLQDQQIEHIIRWTQDEISFVILNIPQFTQLVLPKYFRHQNYSSFIRQLNMYGFTKIRHNEGQNVYTNQNFIKGNRNLLKNLKRKVHNDKQQNKIVLYNHNNVKPFIRQIQQLKAKQKDLQNVCKHLIAQNQKLLEDNNSLMQKMKQDSKKKDKKMEQLLLTLILAQNQKQLGNNDQAKILSLMSNDSEQFDQNKILKSIQEQNKKYLALPSKKSENDLNDLDRSLNMSEIQKNQDLQKAKSEFSINEFLNIDNDIDLENNNN